MSDKNKLMLIQYCTIIITWSLDPETPILGSRNDPTPFFCCIKLPINAQKLV